MIQMFFCLGNPGYDNTPHNLGFMLADAIIKNFAPLRYKTRKQECFTFKHSNQSIVISKPLTYMNLSGEAVKEMYNASKMQIDDFINSIFIVFDDADLLMHNIKLKEGYGSGGHNGIRSINETLAILARRKNIITKRIAIGCRNDVRDKTPLGEYVLKAMKKDDCMLWSEKFQTWIDNFFGK